MNDLFDIQADRQHPKKRFRPIAAADVSIPLGFALALVLALVGVVIALIVSKAFLLILATYIGAATAYSAYLKRIAVADVFALATLYVLRIFGGGVLTGIEISNWLLAFASFFFLSLAFLKRYAEVRRKQGSVAGRAYTSEDVAWLQGIGPSSGYMAVLVLALYVNSPEVRLLYRHQQVLWFLCPLLLFWIAMMWFRASRGLLEDDPVLEAIKDPISYVTAFAAAVVLTAAL